MRTEQEIRLKLKYERKAIAKFQGSEEGSDAHLRLKVAENIVTVLEWVLSTKV